MNDEVRSILTGITVVVCTRARTDDLRRCINSLSVQHCNQLTVEVLVIDDGDLSFETISELRAKVSRFEFRHIKKRTPGLFNSRLTAIEESKYNIVLFIDDDVELEPDYLVTLWNTYTTNPEVVGVGGVDTMLKGTHRWKWFSLVTGRGSLNPGCLSASGYGGSMDRWAMADRAFRTEYLSGCNMSFKRDAICCVGQVDWLRDYSLGEDLYLSTIANRTGPLLVNPKLRLRHYQSPTSRDRTTDVARTKIVNHYYILIAKGANRLSYIFLLWTGLCLCLQSLIQLKFDELRGHGNGMAFLIKSLLRLGTTGK